jgi:arginyl-tRNA synthetase
MRKSDGTYTYFVPDVAYHASKWQRGFTKVINVQGSDHHGTIARVRSGLQGVAQKRGWAIPADYPDYVLHKMVTVMRHGQEVKISKRAGSYVTVRDLVEWSGGVTESMNVEERELALQRGRDAVRFFLISRKADTEFVFDVDLALQQNDENPVFYVQYAHARICSILLQWSGTESDLLNANLSLLDSKAADHLLRRLAEYPEMLTTAAAELSPHAVAFYLRDLAGDFHTFYNADRVLVDDANLKLARLALLSATRQVIENGLALLGVSAPRKM